ncbi:PEP-CTERM sorting domain-containing protein [Rhodoferax saidenbachensis]|uniref:Ice-binding protein C-terminal domain-containing protein n=1 Tax=Rhodoferax saidenbachensis TaxID=1484693 RepID=A0ABU1ZSP9_9BURK|nr:PEP-CTERM sorting domain-containing protein [Rhodoferax saidenbachensis]MDR7308564.1 hypothetical protein [Rhodoferax saidenbachensis]
MKKLLGALTLLAVSSLSQAASNVALGSSVTTTGSGFGNDGGWCCSAPAALSTVVDGSFVANGQQWNIGTVFWGGAYGADVITISLPTLSSVSSLVLQGDNNDDYLIRYRNASNVWADLATISPNRSWGMDMGGATFASPVTANAFSISIVGGDGLASVSEFQAIGAPVPEPETYALLLAGLGLVGTVARRRQARRQG